MIVQLTGTLVDATPSRVVLDVAGVGYELGISSTTAAALPAVGESGVTLLCRMIVREDALTLYGFASREERSLFDHLISVSGVGPKLALSVLSTFTAKALVDIVGSEDSARLSTVPGVGKKTAGRMILELKGVFSKDPELMGLAGLALSGVTPAGGDDSAGATGEAAAALLSMGFTPQEAKLALEGAPEPAAIEAVLGYALRRLGRGA